MYPKGQNKTPKVLKIQRLRGCNIYSSSIVAGGFPVQS